MELIKGEQEVLSCGPLTLTTVRVIHDHGYGAFGSVPLDEITGYSIRPTSRPILAIIALVLAVISLTVIVDGCVTTGASSYHPRGDAWAYNGFGGVLTLALSGVFFMGYRRTCRSDVVVASAGYRIEAQMVGKKAVELQGFLTAIQTAKESRART
jgi:hypothetical protein